MNIKLRDRQDVERVVDEFKGWLNMFAFIPEELVNSLGDFVFHFLHEDLVRLYALNDFDDLTEEQLSDYCENLNEVNIIEYPFEKVPEAGLELLLKYVGAVDEGNI